MKNSRLRVNEKMNKFKIRNSSLELLKIIALMLIVISHSVPYYGDTTSISFIDLGIATNDITVFILNLIRCFGQIGNILFIICSSYFLLESKKSKKEKILNIILDSFVISMLFVLIAVLLKCNITSKDFIKQFLPITSQNNWFIGCYLLLYIIHPLMNIIISSLNKKQLFRIDLILIFLYCIVQFVIDGKYYYNELIGFILIYFLVAYIKLYMINFVKNIKINFILILVSLIGMVILLIITNILGLKFNIFSDKLLYWNKISNPMYILLSIGLFNIFNSKKFVNKFINYISSLSLIFYMIHDNLLFRRYIKPEFYKLVFPYGHILIWVIIEAIILFICGMLISTIYKETIQKIVYIASNKIYNLSRKIYFKIEIKLLQKE